MVWEACNSVYRLMVQKLSVFPGVALDLLHNVLSILETSPSHQSNAIALFFSIWSVLYLGLWQLCLFCERNINDDFFSKSRPYLANMLKVTYWQYPCVDGCVKTNSFTGVHFKSCASRIRLNGLSDSLSAPCLPLHSLSLGQLRFLLQARVYPHVQFLDWILLLSITGEISKP